jgi:hypothetical protein
LADGPHPTLGERVRDRRLHGGAHRFDADRGHDGVEAGRELGVPVTQEEAERRLLFFQVSNEVARHLGDPRAVGVGGHAEEVHDAALDLDHEEHVVAAEQHAVDGEEVGSQDQFRLGTEEL